MAATSAEDDTTTDVTELGALPNLSRLLVDAARHAVPDLLTGIDKLPGIGADPGAEAPAAKDSDGTPGSGGTGGDLPDRAVIVRDVEVQIAPVADYAQVCGFRLDSQVPVTWPHMLGFPLSMWLMTRPAFPHQLLGLVHVRNQVTAREHVAIGDRLDVTAHVANQRSHRRGVTFDAIAQVHRGDRLVWESTSTYLRRGDGSEDRAGGEDRTGGVEPREDTDMADTAPARQASSSEPNFDLTDMALTGRWSLAADLGRRYAEVSGDRNPIHMSAISARAFGFPRAIAHGMWTKAAALAGLGTLERPVDIDVVFRKPVLLPSQVDYVTARTDTGWQFGLRRRDGAPHLLGTVTT